MTEMLDYGSTYSLWQPESFNEKVTLEIGIIRRRMMVEVVTEVTNMIVNSLYLLMV